MTFQAPILDIIRYKTKYQTIIYAMAMRTMFDAVDSYHDAQLYGHNHRRM